MHLMLAVDFWGLLAFGIVAVPIVAWKIRTGR